MAEACAVCREPIVEDVIFAGALTVHSGCFACVQCLESLPNGKFFDKDMRLYCEVDYMLLFGDRCARCGEAILGRCLNALDLKWHPEHFTCDECGDSLAGSSFFKRLGRPFCKPCNEKLKQTEAELAKNLCMRCKKPIVDKTELLILQKEKFHAYHFSCASCSRNLDAECKDLDGKLYCPPCYNKAMVATCATCRRPIEGRSVTALGKQYHPEHFTCAKCEKPFLGIVFYEHQGLPFCEAHYNELTGDACGRCGRPSQGRSVNALNRHWCEGHFCCVGCDVDLATTESPKFFDRDSLPVCKNCYKALPSVVQRKLAHYAEQERKVKAEREKNAAKEAAKEAKRKT